ncbi:MAG: EthD domain-containing protein [Actinomycetota bacterium]
MLELVGLCTDPEAARAAAVATAGTLDVNHPGESPERPYSAMIRAVTDNVEALADVADFGLYSCFARVIKAEPDPLPSDRSVAAFAMIGHPDLSHREADDHWRDVHAPLALENHRAMCDYTQLSVVATISGQPLDGIALCAFATREDLSKKFFNDDEARATIGADVARFADLRSSIRRVVLVRATDSGTSSGDGTD